MTGDRATRGNLITSLHIGIDELEHHNRQLEAKYQRARCEARAEEFCLDDAEIVLVGYGIVGRILKAVAAEARAEGIRAGVLRPISLYPFPSEHLRKAAAHARVFAVVEMSMGQMVDDVRLALNGVRPVEFFEAACGGNGAATCMQEVLAPWMVRQTSSPASFLGATPTSAQEKEQMVHA